MSKFLLLDTFNFLHRAYHALPKTFTDKDGNPTNAIYGVTSMLLNVFSSVKPNYVVAALDGMKPTFRAEEFVNYKAHRAETDNDLVSQIPKIFDVLEAFGVKQILVEGYEADDVIGTLCTQFKSHKDLQFVVVSNDKDLWQLVDDQVMIMVPSTKSGLVDWYGAKEVETRMGFKPELVPDYKGLRGDPSDNIPGVYGVGDITAVKLINQFGTMENIYKNIKDVEPVKLREKLLNNYEQALMSKRLAQIVLDVPVGVSLKDCMYYDYDRDKVLKILQKYNFRSLINRLGLQDYEKKQIENENQLNLF